MPRTSQRDLRQLSPTRQGLAEFCTRRTQDAAREPMAWLSTAKELRQACDVLRQAMKADEDGWRNVATQPAAYTRGIELFANLGLWRVYFLLAGLSLEN